MAKPKDKESSVDVVEESKNDVFNMPFDQAFPATEELQSDNLTLEDAHAAPRRVQGQVAETLICIEPPDDVIADIQAAHAGLEFVDEFKIILGRCSGSAYDVGAALNGQLDVNSTATFNSDGYLADGSAYNSPLYYHAMVINDAPVLAEQIGEALEVAGIEPGPHDFAPRMMVGMAPAAVEAPHFTYSFPIDEVIVDDGVSRVPVKVKSSAAKMKPADSENAQSDKEAAGWNLAELTTPGITSDSMEDIGQRFTNPNVFEDPRGRMAQISTTTTGLSPRGNKVIAIKNGNDKYIYNLAIPGQRLMVLGGAMPRLAPASVSVDSLYDEHADTLSNEDAMLGDHLADLVAGKKTGDVEEPYSQGDGPMGVRFEEDKEYNIVKGAQIKELSRRPTTLDVDDRELEVGREQYFLPDSTPDSIEEVEYQLPYGDAEHFYYDDNSQVSRYGDYIYLQEGAKDYIIISKDGVLYFTHIMSTTAGPQITLNWHGLPEYGYANQLHDILIGESGDSTRPSTDPVIESIIDQLIIPGTARIVRGDTWVMSNGSWVPRPEEAGATKVHRQVLLGSIESKHAQVDWENATPEQLRLRDIGKAKAKTPAQLGMKPYETRDSTEPVSGLPADTQVRIDEAQEGFPGVPSVLTHHTVKGPTLDINFDYQIFTQKVPGTNMINSVHPGREPGEYRVEDLSSDLAFNLDLGVEPESGQLIASWSLTENWHVEADEFSDSTDPVIDDVLPDIAKFMNATGHGTAQKIDGKWELVDSDTRNVDTRLAGSGEGPPVTIDDEIEKDAVGLIEGPVVNEDHGDDFSRADQAIPRPRGMDKFIHRK